MKESSSEDSEEELCMGGCSGGGALWESSSVWVGKDWGFFRRLLTRGARMIL